jgi:hypothetical protein
MSVSPFVTAVTTVVTRTQRVSAAVGVPVVPGVFVSVQRAILD